jgi:hypothetical protein
LREYLTPPETKILAAKLEAWKKKCGKPWVQLARDFSVCRALLHQIRHGHSCRVSIARKIAKGIGWRTFRAPIRATHLWDPAQIQKAASSASVRAQPLLLLQILHSAASSLHLALSLRGISTKMILPEQPANDAVSRVVVHNPMGTPLLDVCFRIDSNQLRYSLRKFNLGSSLSVVGEGYASSEGFSFCEEFLMTFVSGTETATGRAARKKLVETFNAFQNHGGKRTQHHAGRS